jgi:acetyl-CoA synthetase
MGCAFDMHLLVLDFPRADRCDGATWQGTVDAWVAAHQQTGARACVLASMPEGLPDGISRALLAQGIAPMQGIAECLDALVNAALIGAARRRSTQPLQLESVHEMTRSDIGMLDESASKQALTAFGLPVPRSEVVSAGDAVACAGRLGYPVVVKAVSHTLAMAHLSERFLVEKMVTDAVAEIIVGVHRDAQFGLALTLGAGGIFVELLKDTVTLLLPVTRAEVGAALASLKTWPLVSGYRSRAQGDVEALLDAVMAIAAYAQANSGSLDELDVNPLMVRPRGEGVLAVDAMVRISRED